MASSRHTLLYGGTFDPIHHGHLITSQAAREIQQADQVLFIPAGVSPHKLADTATIAAEHRLAMIQLAIAGEPHFAVDSRELARAGPSYTIDTVLQLKNERPGDTFTWLLGADQLPKLPTWHRFKELEALVRFAVLGRPEAAAGSLYPVLKTPLIDISATEIRGRIAAGLPVQYLVPPAVADYIRDHRLYRAG